MEYSWSARGNARATQFLSRVLSRGQLSHAYLFVGGENSEARLIGREFVEHMSGSKEVVVIDEGKNDKGEKVRGITIHQIRELIKVLSKGLYKTTSQVIVIDPPEPFSKEAGNALLKILEEPPVATTFVLYVDRVEDMLLTIASRCQIIRCYAPQGGDAVQLTEADEFVEDFMAMPLYAKLRALSDLEPGILDAVERWIDRSMKDAHTLEEYYSLAALTNAVVSSRRYASSYLSSTVLLEPIAFALH